MYLGIDVGSISCKAIIINSEKEIIFNKYSFHNGDPVKYTKKILSEAKESGFNNFNSICTTGSGRKIIGKILKAEKIKNEITCTWRAVNLINPETRTIIEIGGQDSKLITLKNGEIDQFKLNSVCAAGTGSFIQQQANRLGISIEDLARESEKAAPEAHFTGRCTVFVETEMINIQQQGVSISSIARGLMDAVCENYLKDLSPGIKISPPLIFCGGVSEIGPIKKRFEEKLKIKIDVPRVNKVMAAFGAALTAYDYAVKNKINTSRPIDLKTFNIKNIHKSCNRECINCGKCDRPNLIF